MCLSIAILLLCQKECWSINMREVSSFSLLRSYSSSCQFLLDQNFIIAGYVFSVFLKSVTQCRLFYFLGPTAIWHICPLFKGIGYSMFLLNFFVAIYYNVVLGWVIYYLVNSFTTQLPWDGCDHSWNSDHCNQPLKYCIEHVRSFQLKVSVNFSQNSGLMKSQDPGHYQTLWLEKLLSDPWKKKISSLVVMLDSDF